MSGRYVRMSKFRHVFGEGAKTEASYTDVKALTAGDGNFIKVNTKFFAYAKPGGGGPVVVHKLGDYGRMPINKPVLNVHKSQVLDFDFCPFDENIIATASDDCSIAVTRFPDAGVHENITDSDAVLQGHTKKLTLIHWHPSANNVLGSVSADRDLKIWDVEAQDDLVTFEGHEDNVFSFEWSADGKYILTTSRDRMVRMFDPRVDDPVIETESHEGAKTSRCFWVDDMNFFGSVGFSKTSQRKIFFWDPRKPEDWIHKTDLDQAASVLCPFYDAATSILFLAGKGDGTIRYFEITNQAGFCHYLSDFRNNTPQKGSAWKPKRGCDVTKAEIASFVRLTRDTVHPVSLCCPRKNAANVFQEDIFPDSFSGEPTINADAYFNQENALTKKKTMKPAGGKEGRGSSRRQKSTLNRPRESPKPKEPKAEPEPAAVKPKRYKPKRQSDRQERQVASGGGADEKAYEAKIEKIREELSKEVSKNKTYKSRIRELEEEVEESDSIIQAQAAKIKALTEQLAKLMM